MRLTTCAAPLAFLALCAVLAGCGSSPSSQDKLRSAVSDMRRAIQTYNRSSPRSLAATGSACAAALDAIKGDRGPLEDRSLASRYRREQEALHRAWTLATSGFLDCSRAARSLNYPRMVRANGEIAQANAWIQEARTLDR
ncbi:MAG: hypothetical protein JOZ41_17450 [Chloroflexi bacterium]|nr:hypothetical protein [Chloroflexota bacterium]